MTGEREVARGLLFDDERVLLIHWRDPVTGHEFLEPPGGLVEAGESLEDAVRREIAEETGLAGVEVDRFLTEVHHVFTFAGELYDCRERYYLCRLTGDGRAARVLDPVEASGIVGVEWVGVEDLAGRPADSLEPPQLLEMLRDLGRL
jgi:8-oxo-dGTP pyrophosphatase MutT (NUDIX family)